MPNWKSRWWRRSSRHSLPSKARCCLSRSSATRSLPRLSMCAPCPLCQGPPARNSRPWSTSSIAKIKCPIQVRHVWPTVFVIRQSVRKESWEKRMIMVNQIMNTGDRFEMILVNIRLLLEFSCDLVFVISPTTFHLQHSISQNLRSYGPIPL